MADSLFGSLLNMVDSRMVGNVAHAIGQPENAVSRGVETSLASILGGVCNKAGDSGALGKLLDLVPNTLRDTSWSQAITSMGDRNSTLMSTGSQILGSLFGNREITVANAVSQESGLPASACSNLLTMAAPLVLGFLSRKARDSGMGISGLSTLLQGESSTIRNFMPAGIREIFWPTATTTAKTSPVIAQTVQEEEAKSASAWPVAALAAIGLGLGLIWLLNNAHRPTIQTATVRPIRPLGPMSPTGSANREVIPTPQSTCSLPAGVIFKSGSPLERFTVFLRNPNGSSDWYTMDQVSFASGSAKLPATANAQIDNVAAILRNCPDVRVTIAGYTDNVGANEPNLRLSRNRANSVVAQLQKKGVTPGQITAEGYGKDFPVGDNSTAEGRAENRRIAMRVNTK